MTGGMSIQGERARANAYADDVALNFGSGDTVKILFETADGNSNHLNVVFPEGGATDVPIIVFGDASIDNVDLGWFNGVTEPTIAVVNDAADAYASLDAGDDAVAGSKGLYFKAAADEDIELVNLSVTGTPRIYWDESEDQFRSTKGWVFDAACDVQGTWVATAAWTLPALTLGGTVTVNAQNLDAGAGVVQIITTGAEGLNVQSNADGTEGGSIILYQNSANPAIDDMNRIMFRGKDDGGTARNYIQIYGLIETVAAATHAGKMQILTRFAGAQNTALTLSGAGALWTDLSVDTLTYKVSGTQVVSAQGAAVADVSDGLLATTITQLNALLARLRTHGMIAT